MKSHNLRTSQKFYLFFKRLIDIFGSLIGILLCFILLWWWVVIINLFFTQGHPFFVQERIGKNKRVFKLIKFRSMKLGTKEIPPSQMTVDYQKSLETKFGRFLRKTSIDETPQLFNILFGSMAFIGPRPGAAHNEEIVFNERNKYTPSAFDVKPGLSGYAQIKMDRDNDPILKAYWDHIYVTRMSFWLDAKIFIYTILHLFGAVKGR